MSGKKLRIYTNEEVNLLVDITLTAEEVANKINVSAITVARYRRKNKLIAPKGAKKGKSVPSRQKKEQRICKNESCDNTFIVAPARKKQYCSISCAEKSIDHYWCRGHRPSKETTSEYKAYARRVHGLSQKVYDDNIDIINPYRYPRTLCGVEGGWQLDHIKPIKECYSEGLSIEDASSISNLRMLPWKENLMRNYVNKD